jgi:DNA-directed RNA polymerase specialized sigma24 family protein
VAKRRNRRGDAASAEPSANLEQSFARIANLLALLLVKGESESEKVVTLSSVGFSAQEIGRLLNKLPNTVSVILYQAKKQKRK